MKTTAGLKQDILTLTTKINREFPELSKFIKEIPVKASDEENDEINRKHLKDYYQSLVVMLEMNSNSPSELTGETDTRMLASPGYPLYPPSEDIYNRAKKEMDIDPDDPSKHKTRNETAGSQNEKDFDGNRSGDDLDVPGSELDNQQESVGSEDEENNYYSLGGDNHTNLDENKD